MNSASKAKKKSAKSKRGRPVVDAEKKPSIIKEIKGREFYAPAPDDIDVSYFLDNYCNESSSVYLTPDLAILVVALSKKERRSYSNSMGGIIVEGLRNLELLDDNNEFTDEAIELIENLSS